MPGRTAGTPTAGAARSARATGASGPRRTKLDGEEQEAARPGVTADSTRTAGTAVDPASASYFRRRRQRSSRTGSARTTSTTQTARPATAEHPTAAAAVTSTTAVTASGC